jgi:hypothetical protein
MRCLKFAHTTDLDVQRVSKTYIDMRVITPSTATLKAILWNISDGIVVTMTATSPNMVIE